MEVDDELVQCVQLLVCVLGNVVASCFEYWLRGIVYGFSLDILDEGVVGLSLGQHIQLLSYVLNVGNVLEGQDEHGHEVSHYE